MYYKNIKAFVDVESMNALFLYLEDGNMGIIKALKDIESLKEKSNVNREVLQEIEEYFKNI